jgi:hypothetical protein
MEFTGSGAGIMLALAALLWLTYLVPSWFKRREYLATERNAVRLQQSLRILAQTAEVPHVVHLESSARSVAQQERLRREQDKRRKIEDRRLAAEARSRSAAAARIARSVALAQPGAAIPAVRTSAARTAGLSSTRVARLRRSRVLATSMLVAAASGVVLLGSVIATFGGTFPNLIGLVASGCLGVVSVALLNRLAAVARTLAPAAPQVRRAQAFADLAPLRPDVREWTPVPLPKPLYMSKPRVDPPVMVDPRENERIAAAADAGEVTQLAPTSRFAAMGRIDLGASAAPDLEAALRRRRTG